MDQYHQITESNHNSSSAKEGKRLKRALVLAGGGAKGAYAFGCMKAFREAKIEFDAVAGTSVGALNAAVWATDSFDLGEEVWRSLSFPTIYPIKILDPKRHYRAVILLVAGAFVFYRLLLLTLLGRAVAGARPWLASVVATAALLPMLCAAIVTQSVLYLVLGACFYWLCRVLLRAGHLWQAAFATALLAYSWYMGVVAIASILLGTITFLIVGVAGLLLSLLLVLSWVLLTSQDRAVLSRSPLRKLLNEIFKKPIKCDVFVTAAHEVAVFDPDDPAWYTNDFMASGRAAMGAVWEPDVKHVWVPRYIQLNGMTEEERTEYCLASAALPFGIVPPISIGGRTCVDGGIADNVPIFPLIKGEYDEVFVVLLDPEKEGERPLQSVGCDVEQWMRRDRDLRLAVFPVPDPYTSSPFGVSQRPYGSKNVPPKVLPYLPAPNWPTVKVFAPSESLGSFLCGTLNFDASYAKRLMAAGYARANSILNNSAATGPKRCKGFRRFLETVLGWCR